MNIKKYTIHVDRFCREGRHAKNHECQGNNVFSLATARLLTYRQRIVSTFLCAEFVIGH